MKLPLVSIAACAALAVARCVRVFEHLPARMMSHFDAAGRPDGFMPRGQFLLIFAIASATAVLALVTAPLLARALPAQLVNVPNRDYWLSPEHRPTFHAKLAQYCAWLAAAIALLLYAALELVLRANLQHQPIAPAPMAMLLIGFLLCGPISLIWAMRAFRVPEPGEPSSRVNQPPHQP